MIDQNTIIEIINKGLPILASSPVLIKLFETVGSVVKALYTPTLTLKNGKAEVDVEIYRKQQEGKLMENQPFTLYEITKLKNFISSAGFAAMELQESDEQVDTKIEFDWIMRFFDAVGNISNEELQRLWGKVLAGEMKQSGTCSLRTMDIIRNLSQKEAGIFNKLSHYVLQSGDYYFILNNGFCGQNEDNVESYNYILKTGLKYSDSVIPMIECGLLSVDNALATDFESNNVLSIQNQEIACFIIANSDSRLNYISIEPYFLTKSGIELYNIIQRMSDYHVNNDYFIICLRELKKQYPNLTFSAHRIMGENNFEPNDLL